jgi:signal transduction histidine kinase
VNLDRTRLRLALGYTGIFVLTVAVLFTVGVLGFSRELVRQQDTLLSQEARNQTLNLLGDEHRETLAEGSREYGWAALDPSGNLIRKDRAADSLGLPHPASAQEALRDEEVVSETIQGADGRVRVLSRPMYEAGELAGVMQYAHSLESTRQRVRGLVLVLLPLSAGALGLAVLGGLFMANRAVRPVRDAFDRQRTFIADASHELKTPLTLIRANAEVLQRGLEDPDYRELTDDVLAEADRMSGILSDLLLVARLDAGKLSVEHEPFDLTKSVSRVVERFRSRAASAGVRLEASGPDRTTALGDVERTEQILVVLLDNALTHTPRGGGVRIVAQERSGCAEAVVRDTGPGVPPEHLPRVFERFYRADSARTRKSGGTGLGLSIARDLARAQNGDLQVENAAGGGAIFRLRLQRPGG